ncbi:hypothetical protein FVW20_05285 [Desulfovibrio oxamicus]|jgi:hypothetical protein|uniref:Uncharacterized protein n=1 Tax=Nitratidesulfovibrio oxamicus TaxID=32016 RepID=A0ABS0J1Z5_9BACT|nr:MULTISPECIES: hypothetical protein [Nitratidesulfovibrio]MBG3876457.1 hypothetical protein [Nitratidesulfovibrio oxamicus]NHZ48643.1 hypothetical protein [Nitratidesulfovibrio liaohensis]
MYQNVELLCASVGFDNVEQTNYDETALRATLRLPMDRRMLIGKNLGLIQKLTAYRRERQAAGENQKLFAES